MSPCSLLSRVSFRAILTFSSLGSLKPGQSTESISVPRSFFSAQFATYALHVDTPPSRCYLHNLHNASTREQTAPCFLKEKYAVLVIPPMQHVAFSPGHLCPVYFKQQGHFLLCYQHNFHAISKGSSNQYPSKTLCLLWENASKNKYFKTLLFLHATTQISFLVNYSKYLKKHWISLKN